MEESDNFILTGAERIDMFRIARPAHYKMKRYTIKTGSLLFAAFFCLFIFAAASVISPRAASAFDVNNSPVALNHSDTKEIAEGIGFYKPSSQTEPYPSIQDSNVDNVIFCIGDGMGAGQVALAQITSAGMDGKLYLQRMPVVGIIRTHSADYVVTDSAAAATALATGFKTNNKMIATGPDGEKYLTILEAARDAGMTTGLVVTSNITDATPACFGAHNKSRYMESQIAEDLLAEKINVMFGGGREFFLPKATENSKRTDERDLIDEAKDAGYCYAQTADELKSADGLYVIGLFQIGGLTTKPPEPTLAEMTDKAVELLNKKDKKKSESSRQNKGFFLMVEGSQIDWACHRNDANDTIRQTLRFDEAVRSAVEFALKNRHTIVIVTADHETGGLVIVGGKLPGKNPELYWSTKNHSGLPVPLYAFGPKASIFAGVYDNTEVPKKLAKLLGITSFPRKIKPNASELSLVPNTAQGR